LPRILMLRSFQSLPSDEYPEKVFLDFSVTKIKELINVCASSCG
jgi:hypothetical protein